MISFNSTITNLGAFNTSILWQIAESYCNIGQTAYRIVKIEGKRIDLDPTDSNSNFLITLAKIISYFSLILPAIALCIREGYRRSYQFEIIPRPLDEYNIEEDDLKDEVNERPCVDTAYKIEEVITQLQQAQKEGEFKLGLFVGRSQDETIPQEEGWLWCSLDSKEITSSLHKRLHLCMDFNDQEEMQKIQRLFDKVVSDFSVLKFFRSPWKTLKSLLANKPDAELVAEGWAGFSIVKSINHPIYQAAHATMVTPISDITNYHQEEERVFNQWKQNIGEQAVNEHYQKFLTDMPEDEKQETLRMYSGSDQGLQLNFMRTILKQNGLTPQKMDRVPELLAKIKAYLLRDFEEVTLMNGVYPYRDKKEEIITEYWIARHPLN